LSRIINVWAEAKRIEEFFTDAEQRAMDLNDEEREFILERLKLAREMVGGTDALQWFGAWKAPDER
jgi:hypothetical protein